MKQNKIIIRINKPLKEVFEFTTNPKNTYLWIPSIAEEVASEFPPKLGIIYKNRGTDADWSEYTVEEYNPPKLFSLTDSNQNYHVRYTYKMLSEDLTEMEYFEWMKNGELETPFTQKILDGLKNIIEK